MSIFEDTFNALTNNKTDERSNASIDPRKPGSGDADSSSRKNLGLLVAKAIVGVILLIVVIANWPITSVSTGYRGVITVGGRIQGIAEEGFMWIWPWQKKVDFNIRAEQADIEKAEGSTNDTQPVSVSLTVRYSIKVDRVSEVYEKYSHDGNLSSYVQTASAEVFKAVTAKYSATDLISKRSDVSSDIATQLRAKMQVFGAQIISIDMRNFSFSPSYMAAINEKVTQEQLRQAADNKLKTVESEQKQKVAVATAEADALRATADGTAYSQLKIATAQADSLKVQNAALSQNKDVLELRRIEVEQTKANKWNGALPTSIYAGAPIPFMNLPNGK